MLFFTSILLAAPPGYKITNADHNGCEVSLGPAMADGVAPMHAECNWADVTMESFDRHLANWAGHDAIFTVVTASEVRRTDGNRALVFQRHHTRGISDREVLLWMSRSTVDGAHRYGWTAAVEEALTPAEGGVRTKRDDGYWQASPNAAGGVTVVHHLEYDPGGSVPGFVVRWFQTSGLQTNLDEMHAALK